MSKKEKTKEQLAEDILDKYYPTNRTVFREDILTAMVEYGDARFSSGYTEGHNDGYICGTRDADN